ncbi:MAG: TlpA family protein disulfide reductase [Myxococcota bacterium]
MISVLSSIYASAWRVWCVFSYAVPLSLLPPTRRTWASLPCFRLLLCSVAVTLSCAHGGPSARGLRGLASVDLRTVDGEQLTLAQLDAKVIVVDVCAVWSDACLLNGRVLDEVAATLAKEPVQVVTLLVDEAGPPAVEGYRAVMGTSRLVALPGPRSLAGQSELGPLEDAIPRVVIFGPRGDIVADLPGGLLSAHGLVRRVRGLLPH